MVDGFPLVDDDPGESPNGVNSVLPGVVRDAGSVDPSSTSVSGAVSNAFAQMRELESDVSGPRGGSGAGDEIVLPERRY